MLSLYLLQVLLNSINHREQDSVLEGRWGTLSRNREQEVHPTVPEESATPNMPPWCKDHLELIVSKKEQAFLKGAAPSYRKEILGFILLHYQAQNVIIHVGCSIMPGVTWMYS